MIYCLFIFRRTRCTFGMIFIREISFKHRSFTLSTTALSRLHAAVLKGYSTLCGSPLGMDGRSTPNFEQGCVDAVCK